MVSRRASIAWLSFHLCQRRKSECYSLIAATLVVNAGSTQVRAGVVSISHDLAEARYARNLARNAARSFKREKISGQGCCQHMGIADAMQTDKPRAASTVLAVRACRSRALGGALMINRKFRRARRRGVGCRRATGDAAGIPES